MKANLAATAIALLTPVAAAFLGCAGARTVIRADHAEFPVSLTHELRASDGHLLGSDERVTVGTLSTQSTVFGTLYEALPFSPTTDISSEINRQVRTVRGQGITDLKVATGACATDYFLLFHLIPFWPGCARLEITGTIVRQRTMATAATPASTPVPSAVASTLPSSAASPPQQRVPSTAAAAPNPKGATAEVLFREGKQMLERKEFEQACPKLAESYQLDPATGALLALAVCYEGEGRLASAWAEYVKVASRAKAERRKDRERAAREKIAMLEPRLSIVTISVSASADIPGLRVRRDGEDLAKAIWGVAVPVDGGEHLIEALAPGRKGWRLPFSIASQAEKKSVEVPQLDAEAAPLVQEVPPTSKPPSAIDSVPLAAPAASLDVAPLPASITGEAQPGVGSPPRTGMLAMPMIGVSTPVSGPRAFDVATLRVGGLIGWRANESWSLNGGLRFSRTLGANVLDVTEGGSLKLSVAPLHHFDLGMATMVVGPSLDYVDSWSSQTIKDSLGATSMVSSGTSTWLFGLDVGAFVPVGDHVSLAGLLNLSYQTGHSSAHQIDAASGRQTSEGSLTTSWLVLDLNVGAFVPVGHLSLGGLINYTGFLKALGCTSVQNGLSSTCSQTGGKSSGLSFAAFF